MTYHGHIKNGVAVPDGPITLAEGTPVRIEVDRVESSFWCHKSAEELARARGMQPIGGIEDLAGDWPPDDDINEFMAFIRQARR